MIGDGAGGAPRHRPRKRFGQHFLAPAWADKVAAAIAPQTGDRFLEIGPGPGILTSRLAARAASVLAVEIDRDLAAALRRSQPRNVVIAEADFLEFDLSPVLADGPLRVAGNLPYNLSSPILFKLLGAAAASSNLIDATVMLQREVAARLAAAPGSRDYGVMTIVASARADVSLLLTLPPGAFRPAPKVHSAVVRLTFHPSRVPADAAPVFERMVRMVFMQRRKTLGNALRPFADQAGADVATALARAEIDPIRRPETLNLQDFVRLAAAFSGSVAGTEGASHPGRSRSRRRAISPKP